MRRKFLIATLSVLALVSAACGGDDNPAVESDATTTTESGPKSLKVPTFEAGTTMAALQQKGKVIVGTKFDQPLFGLKDPVSNKVEGFDVEIAKLMVQAIFGGTAEAAESKIEFVETVSRNREPFIQEGKVDMVIATYTINDTRKQVVDFAGPYYIAGQDIMVKKGDTSIKSVTDLNGKKVCSVTGSTSIKNVQEKAPQADVSTSFDKYSLCAEALQDGRVQAVTTDNVILLGLIKDNPSAFQLVKNTFTSEPYGIGIKKGDDELRDFLNDRLEAIYESGEWEAAFKATVGEAGEEAGTPDPPEVDRYTAGGGTGTGTSPSSTTTAGSGGATTTSTTSRTATTTTARATTTTR